MELNEIQRQFIDKKLRGLEKSKFRSSFTLGKRELNYLKDRGIDNIYEHAFKFIKTRLGGKNILNDGKQTPMRGHPVFIAQHATATCCRGCLYKWYQIPTNRELSEKEIRFIVVLIISWIIKNSEGR